MKKPDHIGCSGYYYSYWKNKFYPEGLPPARWLEYYSSKFNTVELNGTFYRKPRLSTLQKYAQQTPADFQFAVKMSKYITHILRLKDADASIHEFQDLIKEGLKEKLSNFLFQLPPSFHYSEENLERVITAIPHSPSNVVEFRHASWWTDHVRDVLKKSKLTFCNVDYPGLLTPFMVTSPVFYFRLHGNPVLFKSTYTNQSLTDFTGKIPKGLKSYNIYFNNTYYEAGYSNALEFQKLRQSKQLA